jgi:threonine synthase
MWRFSDLLEIDPSISTSLGEGDTPLLSATCPRLAQSDGPTICFKAEHQNPTGSFKDRVAAMATAIIARDELVGAVGTSSGNGGAAIAAYGARAGFPVILFTASGIVDGKLQQIAAHGAATNIVAELGSAFGGVEDVADTIAAMAADQGWLAFLTGGRYAPEAMRGAETIAFELIEQRSAATAVYVPIGGGGLLASIWRGYRRMGRGTSAPRLIGVQPAGCPTLNLALAGTYDPLDEALTTTISGLQVPVLFDFDATTAITGTGGHVVEVTDQQAWDAQRMLARREGLFVEPAGATALAGLLADLDDGRISTDDDVIVILSGAGHKDAVSAARLGADNAPRSITTGDIRSVLAELEVSS